MTPNEKPQKDRYRISSNDFIRFLLEKSPDSNCPVCNHDQWMIVSEAGEEGITYRLTTPIRNAGKPMSLSMFTIHCEDCGYIRSFAARKVHEWVEANPVAPTEADQEEPEEPEEPEEVGNSTGLNESPEK